MTAADFFKSITPPFNAEMQVKALVAGCYLRDSSDHLALFGCGWSSERNNLSYRAKLFTFLRMSIECCLKSLVVSASPAQERPEEAYRAARNPSHKLVPLADEVRRRGVSELDTSFDAILLQIDGLGIGLRYEVDIAAEFSKETFEQQFFDSGPLSSTICSDEWVLALQTRSVSLYTIANSVFDEHLEQHTSLLGADEIKRRMRMTEFMQNVKLLPKGN